MMSVFYGNPVWIPRIAHRQPYLEFTADGEFAICASEKYWDGTLEYSTDKTTWYEWEAATIYSDNRQLYLRGTGNTIITGQPSEYPQLRNFEVDLYTGTSIECSGSIETLLDWETYASGNHPTMGAYAFAQLFQDCTVLSKAPELTPTILNRHCYDRMFSGCTSLTVAPELPVMTLADYCYFGMFSGCNSLASTPVLPATTLGVSCYENMFGDCTSLTTASTLPATILTDRCYVNMFYGCASLTTAPELSAMTLAEFCYYQMFYGCTSLIAPPALPATTLDIGCYNFMFSGCTSLTTAPELPATTLASACYTMMFSGCTSLKLSTIQSAIYQYSYRIPPRGEGTDPYGAMMYMFSNTGGTFTGTPAINTIYYTDHEPIPAI